MDTTNYPPKMHKYAFAHVVVAVVGSLFNSQPEPALGILGGLFWILLLVSLVYMLIAYKYQREFLKTAYPDRLRYQKIFILAAIILPALAVLAGDLHGQAVFGSDATSSSFVVSGLMMSIPVGITAVSICTLGNAIFILTNGNDIVKILGFIVRTIAWLGLLFITYMGYGLAYSARDPNTE